MKRKKTLLAVLVLMCVLVITGLTVELKEKLKGDLHKLDLALTENEFYLEEEDYASQMTELVQPYLKEHVTEGYFSPEDGIEIFYQSYLRENAIANIVISHGFTESSNKYEEVIYYFLNEGYNVFIMDHRGHGKSTRLVQDLSLVYVDNFDDYISDFASFVQEIVKPQAQDKECYLYAHSMGGGVGAGVLEEYPELFTKAVLTAPMLKINTGYTMNLSKLIANTMSALGQKKAYLFGQYAFDGVRDFSTFALDSEERFNYIFDKLEMNEQIQTYGGSFAWLKACLYGTQKILKAENLEKITADVMVFQAENDTLVLPEGQNRFVNQVESAELIYVADSKHEIYGGLNEIVIPYFNTIFEFYAEK